MDVENVRVAIAALEFGHRHAECDGCPSQPRGTQCARRGVGDCDET